MRREENSRHLFPTEFRNRACVHHAPNAMRIFEHSRTACRRMPDDEDLSKSVIRSLTAFDSQIRQSSGAARRESSRMVKIRNRIARWTLLASGAFVLSWSSWAAVSWLRYGRGSRAGSGDREVSRFLHQYEVEEIFQARIGAPAGLTFDVAEATRIDA